MLSYKLSLEITAYSSLFLGCFVLLQNKRAGINRLFFIFSILVAIYAFFLEKGGYASSPDQALFYFRIMYLGVISLPVVYYHLTLLMTETRSRLIYFIYSLGLVFLVLLPTPIFIAGTRYYDEYKIYALRPGVSYHFFLVFFFAILLYSFYLSFKKYHVVRGLQKIQLGYFIFCSGIGFLGGSLDILPKYGIFIPQFNTYCNYLIAIYIGLFAYAIIKYRLMDIRIIVRKGLIYSLLIAISTGLYLFAVFAIGQVLGLTIGYNPLLIGGLIIFALVFALLPLKNYIQIQVDRVFFKEKYDYQKTIRELSQASVSIIDLGLLLKLISKTIVNKVKVDHMSVYILDKGSSVYSRKEAHSI